MCVYIYLNYSLIDKIRERKKKGHNHIYNKT